MHLLSKLPKYDKLLPQLRLLGKLVLKIGISGNSAPSGVIHEPGLFHGLTLPCSWFVQSLSKHVEGSAKNQCHQWEANNIFLQLPANRGWNKMFFKVSNQKGLCHERNTFVMDNIGPLTKTHANQTHAFTTCKELFKKDITLKFLNKQMRNSVECLPLPQSPQCNVLNFLRLKCNKHTDPLQHPFPITPVRS